MNNSLLKHRAELSAALAAGDYEQTDGGIILLGGAKATGVYFHSVNGQDEQIDSNLLPTEGLTHLLAVALGATAKLPNWYLALYSGAITPTASWTASNFAATASEIVSGTEGYSNATRPAFTAGTAAAGEINNLAAKASFTIACTTSINVNGAGLLSNSGKGSTAGVLVSASRFAQTRQLYNGDTFELGYRVTLTS